MAVGDPSKPVSPPPAPFLSSLILFSLLFSSLPLSVSPSMYVFFCLSAYHFIYICLSTYLSLPPLPVRHLSVHHFSSLPPAVQKRRPKASEPTHHLTRVWGFSSEARFISRVHVVSEELLLCRDMLVLTAKCVLRGRRRRAVVFRLFY